MSSASFYCGDKNKNKKQKKRKKRNDCISLK